MLSKIRESLWLITISLGLAFLISLYLKEIVIAAVCLIAHAICYVLTVDK